MSFYRFEVGQKVRLLNPIVNDGTLYGKQRGERLQNPGDWGYVHSIATFLDDLVYEVNFLTSGQLVGCREKELQDFEAPWSGPLFEPGYLVQAKLALTHQGKTLCSQGSRGKVTVRRHKEGSGYVYEVRFEQDPTQYCLLFETKLEKADDQTAMEI